ncbi:hypothetical protein TVAG_171450 [Trichomonas vaginalis G3]|uniref:Uncharacterized protein n=1 Tax=Trichomonas vaginalis (strain ATCC PRA-98 / G3) TaxID=412133 RepID=A2FZK7_TRIV3|nr:hypothetical protein TVAGG3_0792030 [Trichomonas vaginalis G3]EAX89665.1 hypothetical protein TVAG_171450 [Trichomonas vaginalis G3]KAI5495865.1 hypothetical protein TVAGG3_0792030 [Trichomonas vaginalis G3]|eukprot:XP_001302595.1 hypothetical protein [Trichomonas vaginalis G3]
MYHLNAPDSFVKRSLFKNNTCKTGSFWGLLSSDGSSKVTVSECIFLENKADHTLASTYGGTLTAINCTGDLSVSSENGIVKTNEMTTSSFNLTLSLLSLGKCEAEFPFSFDFILFGSKKKKKLVIDDLLSFNFSLECLFNLTST